MTNTVKILRSTTSGNVPTLVSGQIAINEADNLLFWRDSGGTVHSHQLLITTKTAGDNSTSIATTAFVQAALKLISDTQEASSYTLALADAGTVVEMTSASATTVTVPPNSSVAFPVGTVIVVLQYGAGQVTIAAGTGVTLRNASSLTTRAQYSEVTLRQRAANEWVVAGDMT